MILCRRWCSQTLSKPLSPVSSRRLSELWALVDSWSLRHLPQSAFRSQTYPFICKSMSATPMFYPECYRSALWRKAKDWVAFTSNLACKSILTNVCLDPLFTGLDQPALFCLSELISVSFDLCMSEIYSAIRLTDIAHCYLPLFTALKLRSIAND